MNASKFLKEPLVHFFAVGLLLFAVYAMVNKGSGRSADTIVLDEVRLAALASNFEKTWQRPPTEAELQNQIDAWVREEVLYREGVAIGFDLDDPVIRRRVAQKMSFVADGLVPDKPDDAELADWLARNIGKYEIPAIYSLQQVYINPQRHSGDLDAVIERIKTSLSARPDDTSVGDATLLPTVLESASSVEIKRIFGAEFASNVGKLPAGDWQGPIGSGFGLHLIRISHFVPPREPQLDDVRAAVERDYLTNKSQELNAAFYTALRERYTVRIDSSAVND